MSDVNVRRGDSGGQREKKDTTRKDLSGKDKHRLWLTTKPVEPSTSLISASSLKSPTSPSSDQSFESPISPTSSENLGVPSQGSRSSEKQRIRTFPLGLLKDGGRSSSGTRTDRPKKKTQVSSAPSKDLFSIPEASHENSQTPSTLSDISSVLSNMSSRPSSSRQNENLSGSDHSTGQQFEFPNPTEE